MLSNFNSSTKVCKVVKWSSRLGVCNLQHPSCYKRWRATLIALMSSAVCSQPSHNEICSRQNRPERLGWTLRHMAETGVISKAGGWMLQIGKRHSHPGLRPWWRALKKTLQKVALRTWFPFTELLSTFVYVTKHPCDICKSMGKNQVTHL